MSWILQKNECWGNFQYIKMPQRSFFWRIQDTKIFFWDLPTFTNLDHICLDVEQKFNVNLNNNWRMSVNALAFLDYTICWLSRINSTMICTLCSLGWWNTRALKRTEDLGVTWWPPNKMHWILKYNTRYEILKDLYHYNINVVKSRALHGCSLSCHSRF